MPGRSPGSLAGLRLADMTDGVGAVLAGAANVIMQLSWPPIGYGVLESKVDSGKVTLHPWKRTRTTFTYLAVATMGTDAERARYRGALNGVHARVHSAPGGPVAYDALDPDLQLWVAACLYMGSLDVTERFRGPLDATDADALYAAAAPLGTTLQVRPDMWPPDREAFARYWEAGLARVAIDPAVRAYLDDLAGLAFLPRPLPRLLGRPHRFVTTGFLPPPFREQMGLAWSDADQRRFDGFIGAVAAVSRRLPAPLRRFPLNYFLWDFRLRVLLGRRFL